MKITKKKTTMKNNVYFSQLNAPYRRKKTQDLKHAQNQYATLSTKIHYRTNKKIMVTIHKKNSQILLDQGYINCTKLHEHYPIDYHFQLTKDYNS